MKNKWIRKVAHCLLCLLEKRKVVPYSPWIHKERVWQLTGGPKILISFISIVIHKLYPAGWSLLIQTSIPFLLQHPCYKKAGGCITLFFPYEYELHFLKLPSLQESSISLSPPEFKLWTDPPSSCYAGWLWNVRNRAV